MWHSEAMVFLEGEIFELQGGGNSAICDTAVGPLDFGHANRAKASDMRKYLNGEEYVE
jgi:hypothetical protein